jgi:signal peptidase I
MLPTLMVGDHIIVERFTYGLRLPASKKWIVEFSDPKIGDVIVFTHPENKNLDFIKRVMGLPGDRVEQKGGLLYINGQALDNLEYKVERATSRNNCLAMVADDDLKKIPNALKPIPYFHKLRQFRQYIETLPGGLKHLMIRSVNHPDNFDFEFTVPKRHFFVMGDNRDNSVDSRVYGFVPRENLKGKARVVWMSLNKGHTLCEGGVDTTGGSINFRAYRAFRKII